MTANQADKTNDSTKENNVEETESKSPVSKLRDSYRETKQELQSTKGENKELKEKLASIEEKISSFDEIKEENQKIQEQLAKQTLQQERKEKKQKFFQKRPHLKEYSSEIEENASGEDFEQSALLYLAKEKPSLLTEEGYNKTKTKKMKVSGVSSNGNAKPQDVSTMNADDYINHMKEQ